MSTNRNVILVFNELDGDEGEEFQCIVAIQIWGDKNTPDDIAEEIAEAKNDLDNSYDNEEIEGLFSDDPEEVKKAIKKFEFDSEYKYIAAMAKTALDCDESLNDYDGLGWHEKIEWVASHLEGLLGYRYIETERGEAGCY